MLRSFKSFFKSFKKLSGKIPKIFESWSLFRSFHLKFSSFHRKLQSWLSFISSQQNFRMLILAKTKDLRLPSSFVISFADHCKYPNIINFLSCLILIAENTIFIFQWTLLIDEWRWTIDSLTNVDQVLCVCLWHKLYADVVLTIWQKTVSSLSCHR